MSAYIVSAQRNSSSLLEGININPVQPREIHGYHLIVEPDESAGRTGWEDLFQGAPDPMHRLMEIVDRGILGEGGPQELKNLITVQAVTRGERKHLQEASGLSETPR